MKNTKLVNGKRIEMASEEMKAFNKSRKPDLKRLKDKRTKIREKYLRSTDIYIIEEMEGVNCPQEIKDKRALARQEIKQIGLATSETIDNININF